MGTDAFVISHQTESLDETFFTSQFLSSNDFDMSALQYIARELEIPVRSTVKKASLIAEILQLSFQSITTHRIIVKYLLARKKNWITFKLGNVQNLPWLANPMELITTLGNEEWYGPIDTSSSQSENWYIRPSFIPHWELLPGARSPQESIIRWLCFARISNGIISLHWNGFTYSDSLNRAKNQNIQFPYWQYIPEFFEELITLTRARTQDVNLHKLILHKIWESYRYDRYYHWVDKKIRAESGGVSLNARAGNVQELSVQGIRGLANTIRKSFQHELLSKYKFDLPEPIIFDEVILRTLLREFGTLSYEFSLESETYQKIFRAHCYFGQKPNFNSPDAFSHLRVYTTWQSDSEALDFLLSHLERDDYGNSEPRQGTLFG